MTFAMAEPPQLTQKQLSFLRSKAHPLEPRVGLGKQGPTEGVRRELDQKLATHELVKVRLGRTIEVDLGALATELGAALVQHVGRTATFYRPAAEPKLRLP